MEKMLVCFLIAILPGWSFNGSIEKFTAIEKPTGHLLFNKLQAQGIIKAARFSDEKGTVLCVSMSQQQPSSNDNQAHTESPFSFITGEDERLMQVAMLAGVLLTIFLVFFFYSRFRMNRRISDLANFVDAQSEAGENPFESTFARDETGMQGSTPSYISTDSAPAILIIEQDEELRLFLTNTLRLNYRVISVNDGLKGFRKAFDTVPDLIVANGTIPGVDGVPLCHIIKSTEAISHIPVILLTDDGKKTGNPEIALPADSYLSTAFDAKALLIEVRNLIDHRKRLYATFRNAVFSGGSLEEYNPSDVGFITKLNALLRSRFHDSRFGVDDMMEELSLSKIQLFRKLKVLTNKTPGDYLKHFRILQAKRYLNREYSHVNEVAVKSGFSSLSNFTKSFREVTGQSPMDYVLQAESIASSGSKQ